MSGANPSSFPAASSSAALARALVNWPEVLLLDDRCQGALDLKLRKEMQIELKKLQREVGITFVFVTHDQEEALTMSDRIAVMSQGVALQVGDANDIYEHPNCKFVADFIGDTNFWTARSSRKTARCAWNWTQGAAFGLPLRSRSRPGGKSASRCGPRRCTSGRAW